MKGAADVAVQNGAPLLSPAESRWGMATKNFWKNFRSMGSCVDGLSSLISSKRLKGEKEILKAERPADRSTKFLDEVLDELRWGIKTSQYSFGLVPASSIYMQN